MEETRTTGPLAKFGVYKLLPCPLCLNRELSFGYEYPNYFIKCTPCDLKVTQDRKDKVVGVWNQVPNKKRF